MIIHLAVIIPTMVSVPWKLTRCAAPPIPADYIHNTRTYVGVATVISDLYRCGSSEAKVMEFERQALHAAGCLMEILHMCGSTYQNQTHFCKQTLQQYMLRFSAHTDKFQITPRKQYRQLLYHTCSGPVQ